jgi:3-oxoadipate enol-lactonase
MKTASVGKYELAYVTEGSGAPLLLIHGLAGDHQAWKPQIAEWSKQFHIVAPDSRGAGRSTQVDEKISTGDMAEDFLGLMSSLGIERFHVVGRSLGGAIGQRMALKAPERILSLAMLASYSALDPVGKRSLENMREVLELTGSWAAHARHSVLNFVSHEFFNTQKEKVAEIERIIASSDRKHACYIRQNHAVIAHNSLDELHKIKCPVSVMSGGVDSLCGPLATRWMVEKLHKPDWTVFERSSHFFLMEEHERFMGAMKVWLNKIAN